MVYDITSRCRLCAELCDGSKDNFFNCGHDMFLDLVSRYISISITLEDVLPVNICEMCRVTIQSFDDYVLRCKDTQETLRALHENDELQDKLITSLKVEVKEEGEENTNIEDLIKTESFDFYDDEFCNEDSLPLIETIRNSRSVKKQFTSKKKKKSKVKEKKKLKKVNIVAVDDNKINSEDVKCDVKLKKARKEPTDSISSHPFFNFFCHVCKMDCKNFLDLKKHVSSSHSEAAYVICICSQQLRTRQNLFQHLMKHVDGFGIKCHLCTRKFRTQNFYNRHMKTHGEYKCTNCPKSFTTLDAIKSHERVHIPVEVRAIHSCDICNMKFLSKYTVAIHKQTIHEKYKPYICDVCGKNFVTAGALSAHKLVHQNIATITCPQCPKKFKSKARLKRHIDYHNGVSYKCPECSALFNNKRTLTEHFYVHRDVYRYVCGYCDKKFKWKTSFTSHMNNHTGATPYKCEWCPKTFTDGPNCRIHKKRKHPVELAESDAKRAAANPKTKRSTVPIIRDVTLKEPTTDEAIVFPVVKNLNVIIDKPEDIITAELDN